MIYRALLKITSRGFECERLYINSESTVPLSDLLSLEWSRDDLRIIDGFSLALPSIIELLLNTPTWSQKAEKPYNMNFIVKTSYIELHPDNERVIYICSYNEKFMQNWESWEVAAELEAADITKRPTCSQDGWDRFLSTINPNFSHALNIFKLRYPTPDHKEWLFLKRASEHIRQLYYVKPGEYSDVYSYDIKKSYPARVMSEFTPSGPPRFFQGEYRPKRWWGIERVRIYECAPKKYDFLNLCNESFPRVVYLTSEALEWLKKAYNCRFRIIEGCYYKLRRGAFNEFYEQIFSLSSSTPKKHLKTYYKYQGNLLIGRFSRKPRPDKVYSQRKSNILMQERVGKFERPYKALNLFTVSNALNAILKLTYRFHDSIIYINTDGFYSTKPLIFPEMAFAGVAGPLEYRTMYQKFCLKAANHWGGITQDGVFDMRLSGAVPVTKSETYSSFKDGIECMQFGTSRSGFRTVSNTYTLPLKEYTALANCSGALPAGFVDPVAGSVLTEAELLTRSAAVLPASRRE